MTKKESEAFNLTFSLFLTLAVFVVALWGVNRYKNYKGFSSPSSTIAVSDKSAAIDCLPSTMDIQRELNRRGYKLKVDGVCGPATQAAWDLECGNQYAKDLMLKEMK